MANSIADYTDAQIMKCLITHNFSDIGNRFEDDVITKVKHGAFYEATNLDEVKLPKLKEVGHYAFFGTSIANLDLPWDELETIGAYAFNKGFNSLPLNPVFSKLTAIGGSAFAGSSGESNTQLRTIDLPVWTGSTVSDAAFTGSGYMFAYCTALTEVKAPMLTAVPSSAFAYCSALETLNFPKASSISSGAFEGCKNLKYIRVGGPVSALNYYCLPTSGVFEGLILDGVTTVPPATATFFGTNNITKGTAYVYVPASLLDTFKVAANWSNYADQIKALEDFPSSAKFW